MVAEGQSLGATGATGLLLQQATAPPAQVGPPPSIPPCQARCVNASLTVEPVWEHTTSPEAGGREVSLCRGLTLAPP